jgi:hypothetical protein
MLFQEMGRSRGSAGEDQLAVLRGQLCDAERWLAELETALERRDEDVALLAAVQLRRIMAGLDGLCRQIAELEIDDALRLHKVRGRSLAMVPKVDVQIRGLVRIERFLRRHGPYR